MYVVFLWEFDVIVKESFANFKKHKHSTNNK